MKKAIRFIKKTIKLYLEAASSNYSWMYTGCTYYPITKKKESEEKKED